MATVKEGTCLLWILLCIILTHGQEVQLSSSLSLVNREAQSVAMACVGEHVTFECTGNNIVLMRWIMEPFVDTSNPMTFNPTLREGVCLNVLGYDQLTFCLTYKSLSHDNSIANMTTTLKFVAAETIGGISLDGIIVMCNEKKTIIRISKDLPPSVSDLNCSISHIFCDNSTSKVTCTWAPILDHNIINYKFNVTSQAYGPLSPQTIAANESTIEFFLMCSDDAKIVAFGVNNCNVAGSSTSVLASGNCSECNGNGTSSAAITVVTMALVLIVSLCIVVGAIVYYYCMVITNKKPCTQLQITWRKCKDLRLKMSHMHIVKIDNRLFYGGGYTGTSDTANKLYTCTYNGTELSEWTELPGRCPVTRFGLTHYTIEDEVKLVTVGGVEVRRIHNQADSGHLTELILTDEVYTYPTKNIQDGMEWEIGLHKMKKRRLYPATENYKNLVNNKEYIIACGGIPNVYDLDLHHADNISTDAVEIYDGQNWSEINRLPMNRNCLSVTNVDQNLFVIGGGNARKLTNDAAKLLFIDSNSQWEKIQNCPLAGSTAVEVGEKLYVVGGRNIPKWWSLNHKSEVKKSVYVYSDGKWEEVIVKDTTLAPAVYMAAARKLSGSEFIIIGGQHEKDKPVSSVCIGTISELV